MVPVNHIFPRTIPQNISNANSDSIRQEKQEYWRRIEAEQKKEMDRQQLDRYNQWKQAEDARRQQMDLERQARWEWCVLGEWVVI